MLTRRELLCFVGISMAMIVIPMIGEYGAWEIACVCGLWLLTALLGLILLKITK